MVFYGLADLYLQEVIEFFGSADEAEDARKRALADEPSWDPALAVVRVDFEALTRERAGSVRSHFVTSRPRPSDR